MWMKTGELLEHLTAAGHPLSREQLDYIIRSRHTNGLWGSGAVEKRGGRWWLEADRFLAWWKPAAPVDVRLGDLGRQRVKRLAEVAQSLEVEVPELLRRVVDVGLAIEVERAGAVSRWASPTLPPDGRARRAGARPPG